MISKDWLMKVLRAIRDTRLVRNKFELLRLLGPRVLEFEAGEYNFSLLLLLLPLLPLL